MNQSPTRTSARTSLALLLATLLTGLALLLPQQPAEAAPGPIARYLGQVLTHVPVGPPPLSEEVLAPYARPFAGYYIEYETLDADIDFARWLVLKGVLDPRELSIHCLLYDWIDRSRAIRA